MGKRRVPGIKLHDDRVIRLLETLLYAGGLLGDWRTRDLHARLRDRHRLSENDYKLSQLRYDLGKLRTHGLVERIGNSHRYRLTADGLRIGALWVKARTRLWGSMLSSPTAKTTDRGNNPSKVEAALRGVDAAVDALCSTLGFKQAA